MNKDTIYRQDFDKFLEDAEKEAVKNRKYVFASALDTIRGNLKIFPSAQPEYEPVTAEDFAKTMSRITPYSVMDWHGMAFTLMKEMGFVICKKTM